MACERSGPSINGTSEIIYSRSAVTYLAWRVTRGAEQNKKPIKLPIVAQGGETIVSDGAGGLAIVKPVIARKPA